MARTWLSIRVDLVEGRGICFWPRPGRVFAAARRHSFADLAGAIDAAFARWDPSHLHLFTLADGTLLGSDGDQPLDGVFRSDRSKLSRLTGGERFAYTFDLGDDWNHLCTVAEQGVDPFDVLGIQPRQPLAFDGWGDVPDQYGRRWDDDPGDGPLPPDPGVEGLPPLLPHWGPRPA
ncbi:IS1096 element passenger TnpR family protein [Pseudonocardia acidicola]|uniref:Plasmid pRiA4b ORF-3 family protein n=1 Tax=Pseudonocardia acidicola TaxID=2724939 RepID=A0ABX1S8S6_9PSEU|nr:hypothetical protein [Pseudonocardia acidicola]NMH97961.1 plasmid pRiA4b ORF-3 family protein [Pseudonocardia acidicola]